MMLRTFVRNDNVAFPWLAPAGPRRGTVDNAGRLGYVDVNTGEFVQSGLTSGLKDTLYENNVNPITLIPASGITNFGNKTTQGTPSALDRINVARLVAFIRGRLEEIGNQFLFEPNDTITRNEIKGSVESLLNDLLAKRGIFDYLVVCDNSNNTPERIDRSELYVDIAIEPVKAVEFIFIPVRIKNTGEISSGNIASSSTI
jgi:phage tail sheath protein FI